MERVGPSGHVDLDIAFCESNLRGVRARYVLRKTWYGRGGPRCEVLDVKPGVVKPYNSPIPTAAQVTASKRYEQDLRDQEVDGWTVLGGEYEPDEVSRVRKTCVTTSAVCSFALEPQTHAPPQFRRFDISACSTLADWILGEALTSYLNVECETDIKARLRIFDLPSTEHFMRRMYHYDIDPEGMVGAYEPWKACYTDAVAEMTELDLQKRSLYTADCARYVAYATETLRTLVRAWVSAKIGAGQT